MPICSFYGCSVSKSSRWPHMSLFRLPNKTKHPEWNAKVRQVLCRTRDPNSFNLDSAHICSRHFTEDCYEIQSGKRVLKIGAIPTRNLPEKTIDSRLTERKAPSARPEPPLPTRVKYYNLEDVRKATFHLKDDWTIMKSDATKLVIQRKANGDWSVQVSINENLNFAVFVDGHRLPESHKFGNVQQNDLSSILIKTVLNQIWEFSVCEGVCVLQNNPNLPKGAFFHSPMPSFDISTKLNDKDCILRSKDCEGLVKGKKLCHECEKVSEHVSRPPAVINKYVPLSNASHGDLVVSLISSRSDLMAEKKKVNHLLTKIDNIGIEVEKKMSNSLENIINQNGNPFTKLFLEEQKQRWGGYCGKWHPMLIRYALLLHSQSPNAYRTLRKTNVLQLPCERTLKDYRNAIQPKCGIQTEKIQELSTKSSEFIGHQKYVCITFDEMKISEGLVFQNNQVIGFVDLGDQNLNISHGSSSLASHILAIHVIGLTNELKYPLSHYAVTNVNASTLYPIIWDAISYLELECGLKVIACICDGASSNRSFFKMHGNELTYKAKNPYSDDHRYLYFISDPPHLIKTLRNNLSNSDGHSHSKYLQKDGKYILWSHVVKLCRQEEGNQLQRLNKITDEHLKLNAFSKMRVNLATQVLSGKVGKTMRDYGHADMEETAKFILLCDRFFDCCNVKNFKDGKHSLKDDLKPYESVSDPRFEFLLKEFLVYFSEWKASIDSKSEGANKKFISMETYRGLHITCHSMVEMTKFLLLNGMKFVLTGKFSQDVLEDYFGKHRMLGRRSDNPNVYQYGYADNTLRISREMRSILMPKGNVTTKRASNIKMDSSTLNKRTK